MIQFALNIKEALLLLPLLGFLLWTNFIATSFFKFLSGKITQLVIVFIIVEGLSINLNAFNWNNKLIECLEFDLREIEKERERARNRNIELGECITGLSDFISNQ